MSGRYGRYVAAALGGLILTFGCAGSGECEPVRERPQDNTTDELPHAALPATAVHKAAEAASADCRGANPDADASLCYARRSAEAAERQADDADTGGLLGFVQAGGLILSLAFTGWAAASAARASREAARSTFLAQRNQAAHVFMRDIQITKYASQVASPDAPEPVVTISHVGFAPLWKNAGSTPTRKGSNLVSFQLFDGAIPADFDFPDNSNIEDCVTIYIGPGSEIKGGEITLPVGQLRPAGTEQFPLLWGWFEYNDAFSGTPRHRTEFAVHLEILGDPAHPETVIRWGFYKAHNGADDDCRNALRTS